QVRPALLGECISLTARRRATTLLVLRCRCHCLASGTPGLEPGHDPGGEAEDSLASRVRSSKGWTGGEDHVATAHLRRERVAVSTTLFRRQALERVSSPEQLDQTVRASLPLQWVALVSLLAVVAGAVAWAAIAT